jgi:hypothetical protein
LCSNRSAYASLLSWFFPFISLQLVDRIDFCWIDSSRSFLINSLIAFIFPQFVDRIHRSATLWSRSSPQLIERIYRSSNRSSPSSLLGELIAFISPQIVHRIHLSAIRWLEREWVTLTVKRIPFDLLILKKHDTLADQLLPKSSSV